MEDIVVDSFQYIVTKLIAVRIFLTHKKLISEHPPISSISRKYKNGDLYLSSLYLIPSFISMLFLGEGSLYFVALYEKKPVIIRGEKGCSAVMRGSHEDYSSFILAVRLCTRALHVRVNCFWDDGEERRRGRREWSWKHRSEGSVEGGRAAEEG